LDIKAIFVLHDLLRGIHMSLALTTELDATLKRLEIISNNTSDDLTKQLAKECVHHLSMITSQVKEALKQDQPTENK
jgi:hypothetical protein